MWVSTPNRFHAPHTIYALEHGKHVVVEKPMALDLREAEAMNEAAYLEFEDGTPAYVVHDGHGYFYSTELLFGEGNSRYNVEQRKELRHAMAEGARDEEGDKGALRLYGATPQGERVRNHSRNGWIWNPDAGIILVTAERGAMRYAPGGIYVYDDDGQHAVDLTVNEGATERARRGELEEFHRSVVESTPMFHDGFWGMATLEVALAIQESAREHRDILLSHQKAVPDNYDADLKVPYPDR